MRKKHPPFVAGSVAFSLVLGLMTFATPSVSAKAGANTFASIQQQKQQRITGVVTDANGDFTISVPYADATLVVSFKCTVDMKK